MFAVIFEVCPKAEMWDAYLGIAKGLRPELEGIEGFVDNIRYASLTRPGWLVSVSSWRNEKSVIRWRTRMRHHDAQAHGRSEILADYHLCVGEITADTKVPEGHAIVEQRLDETEIGAATVITLIEAKRPAGLVDPAACVDHLGLDRNAPGLVAWDVFDAVLTPGDLILLMSWRSRDDAQAFEKGPALDPAARLRQVRVVRDYSMFDRREAPQYYPAVGRTADR